MKKWVEIALGIMTSIGGFLDVGTLATAAQAGASFGFALLWTLPLGTLCVIFLMEMSGRLAAVSRHPLRAAIHERFGFSFSTWLLAVEFVLNLLVLAAEVGGVCVGLQLATGIGVRVWAIPVASVLLLFLWFGSFAFIEQSVSFLGLITLAFVAAAWRLHPEAGTLAQGLIPRWPQHNAAQYWFIAVSILGSLITPYLLHFYSSGAIEDKWDESYLGINRVVSTLGMAFGSVISAAVLVVAAMVLAPAGIRVDSYEQAALMMVPVIPHGFGLFVGSLLIACFGAAAEVALAQAFVAAQTFGWNYSKNLHASNSSRFTFVYAACIFVAPVLLLAGADPLKLTLFSMALTATCLPLIAVPFLIVMNDEHFVGEHGNGFASNGVVLFVITLAFVLGVVSIPLESFGS